VLRAAAAAASIHLERPVVCLRIAHHLLHSLPSILVLIAPVSSLFSTFARSLSS
jgi:hypothetical protein